MKKIVRNHISNKLCEIDGGVCAPTGFRAGGVFCETEDLLSVRSGFSMVLADRRCVAACVYSDGATIGSPLKVTKKHLKYGLSQAVFINSGIANVQQPQGEKFAKEVCRFIEQCGIADTADVIIGSTGKMSGRLDMPMYERGILALKDVLSPNGSRSAAEALMTTDKTAKELAYSFDLGNYICKIGAICKGSALVAPNMATVLGVITTDISISSAMLEKALRSGVRESFNLLNISDAPSPNDMVCALASGKAGNYKIDCEDTEYKKFAFALSEVLKEMCRRIASDGAEKTLFCRVSGAKSKVLSRTLARRIVGAYAFKESVKSGRLHLDYILGTILSERETTEGVEIGLRSEKGSVVLCADGEPLRRAFERESAVLSASEAELFIDLHEGNFAATAYGCI